MEKTNRMRLMGVDVGFSKTRRTTGIACLDGDNLHLSLAGSSWEDRKQQVPFGFEPDVIAVDGPQLPQGVDEVKRRRCESLFIRRPFWNRCKPGLSHFGFGLSLRRAAGETCAQFAGILSESTKFARTAFASCDGAIVEAFPNAFLAVLLPEEDFKSAPKLKRGQRFDWLYERALGNAIVKSTLFQTAHLPDLAWREFSTQANHEKRAALVCLLTAVFVSQGLAEKVGDAEGGWFWLPPFSLWENWAKEGLRQAEESLLPG
jgi:Protein of unknown function (DUF429)